MCLAFKSQHSTSRGSRTPASDAARVASMAHPGHTVGHQPVPQGLRHHGDAFTVGTGVLDASASGGSRTAPKRRAAFREIVSPKAKSSRSTPGRADHRHRVGGGWVVGQAAAGGVRVLVPSSWFVTFQPSARSSVSLRRARCSGD